MAWVVDVHGKLDDPEMTWACSVGGVECAKTSGVPGPSLTRTASELPKASGGNTLL